MILLKKYEIAKWAFLLRLNKLKNKRNWIKKMSTGRIKIRTLSFYF